MRIYQRLRDEHKVASLEEVKAQVMKDQENGHGHSDIAYLMKVYKGRSGEASKKELKQKILALRTEVFRFFFIL